MKQRLVGALVLLSGGVVLWSVLFTGPAAYKVDRDTQIPPAPPLAEPDPIAPKRPEHIPEVPAEKALPEPPVPDLAESSTPSPKAAEKPAPASKSEEPAAPMLDPGTGVANAWVIQVASFSSSANAEKLKQRLQAKGYKAYVQAAPTASGSVLQRVFVGPELKEDTALQMKADIESSFKLKALIHKFEP